MADSPENTEETPEETAAPVLADFTSVEQFDEHIATLRENPTAANLVAVAEATAAKADYENALAVVAAAEQAVADADTEDITEVTAETEEDADTDTEDVTVEADEVDRELLNASVASTATGDTTDQEPTKPAGAKSRKAQVNHVIGHSKTPVKDVGDMENKFRAALKGSGEALVFEFPVWDREQVGEENILREATKTAEADRIMGLIDESGNPLDGVRSFQKASRVHRASCGGCSDCGAAFETPDCFAEYGEPLGDCFDAIPADTCSWSVEKQMTLADLDQQVYVYCAEDAEGNETAGIVNAEGAVIPIDPAAPETWKKVIPITTTCGDKTLHSLEEFPLLFTIDRKTDKCAKEGAVTRTLNRYFAFQSQFMEARKKAQLRAWGLDNGFAAALAAPSGIGLGYDLATLLNTIAGVIQAQAGVDALEGYKLAVPEGMPAWVNCAAPNAIAELADKTGIAGLVECGGTSPYGDAAAYPITPGAKIPVDALAEALKSWEFVAFDPTQWRKPVGETVRIGVTDTFRDMDLAAQNRRGIVIYRDETLIPVGCVPSVCLDATLCNIPVEPARSAVAGC